MDARVFAGIHFRERLQGRRAPGAQVARFVVRHELAAVEALQAEEVVTGSSTARTPGVRSARTS